MITVRRRPAMLAAGTAALAVFAVCVHAAASERSERVDTRGYRLAPPRSVGGMPQKRSFGDTYVGVVDCEGQPSDADCHQAQTEVWGIGITPRDAHRIIAGATGTGADYRRGEPGAVGSRYLAFRGLQGPVPDPEAALRRMVLSISRDEQPVFGDYGVRWAGPFRPFPLSGYDRAVMECRQGEYRHTSVYDGSVTRIPRSLCVWADRGTVAATESNVSVRELAKLTAELHRTARVKGK
ncbi:hypothetical protein [Streptomyces sp. SudanB25_2051]|uniref:hypothetical protein n=1 Tax=Streptomyces sp. SudanB25_2051 TaxID=3035275 RepID=UPI003F55E5F3